MLTGAAILVAVTFLVSVRRPVTASAQPGPAPAGAGIPATYLRDCATCHAEDGSGTGRGPTLVSVGRASTDYQLRTGRMPLDQPSDPSVRSTPSYPPATVRGLVDYVAGFGAGGVAVPELDLSGADVAKGGELFRLQCAACHNWAGGGGALLYTVAPTVVPADPVEAAEAIRVGPTTMPAFGQAALDDDELDDLVAYVGTLDQPADRGGLALSHVGPLAEGAVAWVVAAGTVLLGIMWMGERSDE
ncbi:MAG: c-type cytochrome [Acidimicrobiales bacterium]